PYPPQPGAGAARTAAEVEALTGAGHEVTVASRRPSAAHLVVPAGGALAAAWLAAGSRRFDRMVLFTSPDFPMRPRASRLLRLVDCVALGAAFGAFGEVRVLLDDVASLYGAVGGRAGRALWSKVTRLEVADRATAGLFTARVGLSPTRLAVAATADDDESPPAPPVPAEPLDWRGATALSRGAVQAEVTRRGAELRRRHPDGTAAVVYGTWEVHG
ncbi:MAG: hypothetical protein ACRD0D_15085, partial [Acidimicrobiales bacterium]